MKINDKRRNTPPEPKTRQERPSMTFSFDETFREANEKLEMISKITPYASASRPSIRGNTLQYAYMDEFTNGSWSHYLSNSWPGYKPEPEGLTGKKKKQWHATQFKAHRAWVAWGKKKVELESQRVQDESDLSVLAEEALIYAVRKELDWGGF